ncbi:MAG: HAD-IA family hydrolase [Planctomycetota bacterium]
MSHVLDLRSYELVIFDCDGVLVDTEPTTNRLIAEVITEAGWPVSAEDSIRMFKGRDLNEIVKDVEAKVGRPLPDLLDEYRRRMYAAFDSGIEPIEGAIDLLDRLDALGAPRRCVASNGPPKKMHASLSACGLLGRFDDGGTPRLFSAYDINAWKPDPALFLHAAEVMGVPPNRCVVIEDSVSGVEAARRAGMPVIALAGLTDAVTLGDAGASVVISALRELTARLG